MKKRRISEFLLDAGVITEDQLAEAINSSNGDKVSRKLVDLGYVSESDITKNLARQLHLNYIDLADYEIDPQAVSLISSDQIHRYEVLPIGFEADKLIVAMADPTDIFAIDDLHVMTGYEIVPVVVTESELQNAINKYSK